MARFASLLPLAVLILAAVGEFVTTGLDTALDVKLRRALTFKARF